jgi:hypothetical protein
MIGRGRCIVFNSRRDEINGATHQKDAVFKSIL